MLSPETQRALAQRLDAELLLQDVRSRLPAEVRDRSPALERVLFRATPRRVLDVAVVALQGGRDLGVLARHLVKKGTVAKPGFSWTEGAGDEALAAVPDEFFAEAVKVVRAT